MSPPFHVNLMLGLRFLQASLLLPLHRHGQFFARAIPIRFEEVSTVKKPGKRAAAEAWEQYRTERQRYNLSRRFVDSAAQIRTALDQAGGASKILLIAGDGSFCNRTVLGTLPARSELIVRCTQRRQALPGGSTRHPAHLRRGQVYAQASAPRR